MTEKYVRSYGLEIERPVSDKRTHRPHPMSQEVFHRIATAAENRGQQPKFHYSDVQPEIILGVVSNDLGEQGVDNGWNLQETALPVTYDLAELSTRAALDTKTIQDSLQEEGATAINMSIHPLGSTDKKTYDSLVVPKSFYPYYWHRGFDHTVGIDAKAQNSPATGVRAEEAADAVSVIIGAGAAFVGIFGNGPFEDGKFSGSKEARGHMHSRKVRGSTVEGDRYTAQLPSDRFHTMADYFQWMYGEKTGIHYVVGGSGKEGYKNLGDNALLIDGNPPVLHYLAGESWGARYFSDVIAKRGEERTIKIKPHISHMESMQFAHQLGAKIRYGLKKEEFPLGDFIKACNNPEEKGVEAIFEKHANFVYIEGRDPGNNLPDREIIEQGDSIARSVTIAPSAIQTGLIRNLSEAVALVERYGWKNLGRLRDAAVKDGLQGEVNDLSVRAFSEDVLEVASRGLQFEEQWMLDYPSWVLRDGKNGADRALEFVDNHRGGKEALVKLVKSREIIIASF